MSRIGLHSVAGQLQARGAEVWQAALSHPMVTAIGDGSLPHSIFRYYFEQNVCYLEEYARAIAHLAARLRPELDLGVLTRFLDQIVNTELPANRRFLARLGGALVSEGTAAVHPTNYAYTRHLLWCAAHGSNAEGLAALLPCQWSYGEIGQMLSRRRPSDEIYADWVEMFAGEGYEDLVAATADLLDEAARLEDAQFDRLATVFDRSTFYEVGFWTMAWSSPSATPADGSRDEAVRTPQRMDEDNPERKEEQR